MRRTWVVVATVFVSLALVSPVVLGTVTAQGGGETGEGGEGSEGGIEGAIGGFVEGEGLLGAVLVLAGGVLLLTAATEKLISYLTRASLGLRMSLFALAIVFTGVEFDDTVLALVLSAGDLEGAALGTALGTGLAIVGVTLALAAMVRPFPVDLPADYVALFAAAPLLLVPFVLLGTLTLVHGLVLLGVSVLAFAYLIVREYQRGVPVFRSTELGKEIRVDGGTEELRTDPGVALPSSVPAIPEDRLLGRFAGSGWAWLGLALVALVGIVFASMLLEAGSEAVIERFGVGETVFGATVLTAVLTFEDVLLTIEPVRRGVPEIGVGNVIGSLLFSVTGNVGVIMLLGDLRIAPSVVTFHLPVVVVVTALAAYFLYRGELKRWHGYLLGGLYVGYWAVAVLALGSVPVAG
jgi:cation:H+ antiporter